MEKRRQTNKTLVERLYHANVLPDGNLNSANTFDVVLMDLKNRGVDQTSPSPDEAKASPTKSDSE